MRIVDGEPPPRTKHVGKSGAYIPLFERARKMDGKWVGARLSHLSPQSIPSVASRIQYGNIAGCEDGEFECRPDGDTIWLRYLGPPLRETSSDEE